MNRPVKKTSVRADFVSSVEPGGMKCLYSFNALISKDSSASTLPTPSLPRTLVPLPAPTLFHFSHSLFHCSLTLPSKTILPAHDLFHSLELLFDVLREAVRTAHAHGTLSLLRVHKVQNIFLGQLSHGELLDLAVALEVHLLPRCQRLGRHEGDLQLPARRRHHLVEAVVEHDVASGRREHHEGDRGGVVGVAENGVDDLPTKEKEEKEERERRGEGGNEKGN